MQPENNTMHLQRQPQLKQRSFWFHIRPKVVFFVGFLMACSVYPYIPLIYLNVLGLDKDRIGVITAVTPFISFVSAPLFSWIVDKTHRPVLVMAVTSVLASLTYWAFVIPGLSFNFACLIAAIQSFLSAPIFPLMDSYILNMLGPNDIALYGQQRLFAAISCGISFAFSAASISVFNGCLVAVFAANSIWTGLFVVTLVVVEMVASRGGRMGMDGDADRDALLGGRRDGESSLEDVDSTDLAGGCERNAEDSVVNDFHDNNFTINSNLLLGESISKNSNSNSDNINNSNDTRSSNNNSSSNNNTTSNISSNDNNNNNNGNTDASSMPNSTLSPKTASSFLWLIRPHSLVFFFCLTILGISFAVVQGFLWIYLTEEKGASTLLLGFTGPFSVAVEIPFFFYSRQILDHLGIQNALILGHLAMTIRLMLYTVLPSGDGAWLVLGIELLHGFSFSLMWTAAVRFASEMAPPELANTSQGVLNGVHAGLGFGVGCIIGGMLYSNLGSINMFRLTAFVTFASMLLFAIVRPLPK